MQVIIPVLQDESGHRLSERRSHCYFNASIIFNLFCFPGPGGAGAFLRWSQRVLEHHIFIDRTQSFKGPSDFVSGLLEIDYWIGQKVLFFHYLLRSLWLNSVADWESTDKAAEIDFHLEPKYLQEWVTQDLPGMWSCSEASSRQSANQSFTWWHFWGRLTRLYHDL